MSPQARPVLTEPSIGELVELAEARLDALGKANADVKLLQTTPGLGPTSIDRTERSPGQTGA